MSISVENLTKTYGPQKAVNNISFEVKTGEVVGFLGPNGAGKSTTMKIIACYMAPTGGDVKLDQYSILSDSGEIKKRIGYLPENNPLYTDMPIIDYLRFCGEIQGMRKSSISERIGEMMRAYMGAIIEMRKDTKESENSSKGYRQRVGLAQAMIHDPDLTTFIEEPLPFRTKPKVSFSEIRTVVKKLGQ